MSKGKSKETIIEYTNTNSDILEKYIAEYQEVAEKADGHAADAERLIEAWPSNWGLISGKDMLNGFKVNIEVLLIFSFFMWILNAWRYWNFIKLFKYGW